MGDFLPPPPFPLPLGEDNGVLLLLLRQKDF